MTSIGYYPGCSLSGTASEYDRSLRAIAGRIGCDLKEVPQWVCCGATSAHAVDHSAAICLAADTLAKARQAGFDRVLAPCAMCYQRLATASQQMSSNPSLATSIASALGEKPGIERIRALSILNWLEEIGPEQLKGSVSKPLKGLKVACYYGCLLVRPPKITGCNDVEAPKSMEKIVEALGAQTVRWSMATECCGASFALSRKDVVLRQGRRICQAAIQAGADILCMACPMCHANIDLRQREFNGADDRALPALYLTQLIGLAFGLSEDELGLRSHFVPAGEVVTTALARV